MGSSETPNLLSATEAIRQIQAGRLTAVELLRTCLAQIERLEPTLKAWAHLEPMIALERAHSIDRSIQEGKTVGPLTGIPVGVKDIFNTTDMPTSMGSPLWTGFTPGNDARVVFYLRQAGAVIPGKTVTAEFAVHTPGPTVNPHHPGHMPGTSSSGSAAAVASFMVPLAIGSQTAGSTIRPASYCGVYGFKPSFGLIPRTGSLKTTDSLDTVGFFARTVEDLGLLLEVLRVHGTDYPISHALLTDATRQKPFHRPWRVALVKGPKWEGAEGYAKEALLRYASKLAAQEGVMVEEVELPPGFDQAHHVHSLVYDKALSYYFKEEFKKETLVSSILKAMIVHGQQIPLSDYHAALQRQRELAQALDDWFKDRVDILLTLSTGGEALKGLDSVDRPDSCLIWTLCGVPTIHLPVFVGPLGLPFGAQVAARRYNDHDLLRFVHFLRQNGLVPDAPYPVPALALQEEASQPKALREVVQ